MFSAIGSQTSGMFGGLKGMLPAMLLAASLLFGGCADSEEDLFISEGSLAAPVPLGQPDILGRESSVGTADSSYYIVNVIKNGDHTITTSGNIEDIDLYVHDVNGFGSSDVPCISVAVGTASESCTTPSLVAATTTNLHIQVKLIGEISTQFILSVTDP